MSLNCNSSSSRNISSRFCCELTWEVSVHCWCTTESRVGCIEPSAVALYTPASMGVISTGDRGDMSPPLFKIPFVSPPKKNYASGHRHGGASVCVCGTSASCEREIERERDRERGRHRELRWLLLASGASSELTEIRSCFKERESSLLWDWERSRQLREVKDSEWLDCKL